MNVSNYEATAFHRLQLSSSFFCEDKLTNATLKQSIKAPKIVNYITASVHGTLFLYFQLAMMFCITEWSIKIGPFLTFNCFAHETLNANCLTQNTRTVVNISGKLLWIQTKFLKKNLSNTIICRHLLQNGDAQTERGREHSETSVKTASELGKQAERRQSKHVRRQPRRDRLQLDLVGVGDTERVDLHLWTVLLGVPRHVGPVAVLPAQCQQLAGDTHWRRTYVGLAVRHYDHRFLRLWTRLDQYLHQPTLPDRCYLSNTICCTTTILTVASLLIDFARSFIHISLSGHLEQFACSADILLCSKSGFKRCLKTFRIPVFDSFSASVASHMAL